MSQNELTSLSIAEGAELIHDRQVSPVEITQAHLERIEQLDCRLNCYITVTSDIALEQAKRAEAALLERSNARFGTLHGIPIALKDLYETQELLTTAGSKFFVNYIPQNNAFVVKRLLDAGAVLLGKLNMHEIALGVTNVNPHFGACHNPWALERISGGSSGGSASALAASMCMGSLGSDTGGSIRIPSSLCGVVGLKPTYGRVSLRGVIPLSWNLDHAGPMARTVQDVAILMQSIAGYDPQDPYSINAPDDDYSAHLQEGVRDWRIALVEDEFFSKADTEVLEHVRKAALVFEELGANIETVSFPGARQAAEANGLMTPCDAAAFHQERLEKQPDYFGEDVLIRLNAGRAFTSSDYVQARRTQILTRRLFEDFFENYDILLTPTTAITAPLIEGPDAVEQARRLTRFTAPFNLTGLPALSLLCGFSSEGMPVGLQIIGGPWQEAHILRAAYAYEQNTEWHFRKPEI